MFSYYNQFLKESENSDIHLAEKLSKNDHLSGVLNDCEEGKFPHVQIVVTSGASSYIGIAFNDGFPVTDVYKTTDPKVALTSIVVKNTNRKDPESIASILKASSDFLTYSVFAGDRKMTRDEISRMFNYDIKISPGDAVPFYTSTPLSNKTY
jgi:hypothetical protein